MSWYFKMHLQYQKKDNVNTSVLERNDHHAIHVANIFLFIQIIRDTSSSVNVKGGLERGGT